MQGSMSGKAANKEQFYVSASRGKFEISVHTDDKEQLLRSVQRSTEEMTATEVKNQKSKVDIDLPDRLKRIGAIYNVAKSKMSKLMVEKIRKTE